MGSRTSRTALAVASGLVLAITGCAGGGESARAGIKVGVIVSDPVTSMRWEEVDQPLLEDALRAQGLAPDVQNSEGDSTKFAAIADGMIKEGVKVLVLAAPNNRVGSAVADQARRRHIPTIDYDYDRLNLGGSSDYSVSFDPAKAGDLQGRGLALGIRGALAHGSTIIELDGPPTDPTTFPLTQAARNILQPRYDTGAYRLAARESLASNQNAGAVFERLLNANAGHVDGVLAANDGVASAVIAVLRKKGLNGKVRVTGWGATPESLKAILRGDQFMTVFAPIDRQATTTATLVGALVRNDRATANAMVSMTMTNPIGHHKIHAVLLPPVFITLDTVKAVVESRMVDSHEVCDRELALRCDQLNIPR